MLFKFSVSFWELIVLSNFLIKNISAISLFLKCFSLCKISGADQSNLYSIDSFCSNSVNRRSDNIMKNYRYKLLNLEIKDLNFNFNYLRAINVPERVLELLSLGDNFGLPLQQSHKKNRISIALETVKNLEANHRHISNELIETTRISIANSLERFLCKNKHINHVDRYILGGFSLCKEFLRNNDDIFVTKADKGHITVVMDKKDYLEKMEYILNDQSTINLLIKSWRDNGLIDETTYKYLNTTNGNLPRCYGLPKIHKTGFPLRIIYIHDILLNSNLQPRSHVKDGWSFAVDMINILMTK
ncbi:hypothetical protein ACFW04_014645 [Cataglyphis niger]